MEGYRLFGRISFVWKDIVCLEGYRLFGRISFVWKDIKVEAFMKSTIQASPVGFLGPIIVCREMTNLISYASPMAGRRK
jgi:hypothetical protein